MALARGGMPLPTTSPRPKGLAYAGIGLRTRNLAIKLTRSLPPSLLRRTFTPHRLTRLLKAALHLTRIPSSPLLVRPLALLAPLLLSGCLGTMPVPMGGLDRRLEAIGSSHSPALSDRWLALIGGRGGREQVVLVDLERQMPVPLPGLNRPDGQPLAVAVDARGERLAVVRQLEGRTELVLYRRSLMALEAVTMEPPGVPRRISLRADGRELAVEVSRGGVWQVDLIQVP